MKTLVIIPAYNEEHNIEHVLSELEQYSEMVDYLVINDCSKDGTRLILHSLGANFLDLPVNLGIGGGVQSGYIYAYENGYDAAVQLDGDGQHDPAFLKRLLRPLEDNEADMVIGSRYINNEGFQSTRMRRLGIGFLSTLIHLCSGVKIKDVTSGYRAINRDLITMFANDYAQDYPEPEAIISARMHKARIVEIPVEMRERARGSSSIRPLHSVYYMLKVSLAVLLYRAMLEKR